MSRVSKRTGRTYSLELGGGNLPSTSQAGPPTAPSGPAPAPASPSVSQEKGEGPPTSATCGPSSSVSSASTALQQSLANRLHQRLGATGSPEYSLTWKAWAMPSREPICALRASAPRTSGNGCGGWPTPTLGNAMGSQAAKDASATGRRPDGSKATVSLNGVARLAGWGSPMSRDYKDGDCDLSKSPVKGHLGRMSLCSSSAPMGKRGVLNPDFVRWLMGFPAAHLNSAPTATPLSRKSRQSS